jgi:polyribonucleotide nucleotidyltransferase
MKTRQFPEFRTFKTTLGGRPLIVETGKMAELANGACLVKYGDTVVLCTATASTRPREGIDYFPLSVDFEERLYSVGRIPGSFMRREGRPTEKAILAARLIDRPMRPLFPNGMRNDCAVCATVLSMDDDCQPEIVAMLGASISVAISDIPWNGPIAGVNVGLVDGAFIINPTAEQRGRNQLNLTVASTLDKVAMIEAGANEVPDDQMYDAIMFGHAEAAKLVAFINGIVKEIGKPKFAPADIPMNKELYEDIKSSLIEELRYCLDTDDKNIREERLSEFRNDLQEKYAEKHPAFDKDIGEVLYQLQKFVIRRWLLDQNKRVDGRGLYDIRALAAEVGVLPRTHGSALFSRGQTQVLSVTTLGTISDVQMLDNIFDDYTATKRFMHHYNFPPYSVGEARSSRGPGRREIGHGALVERALEPVIPPESEFPYCLRVVSEIVSSNGSTSQGSICAATMALMDAGVPIKAPVAGISCGLITEGSEWKTFTDIQGVEDFHGDMDFKVAGTKDGITAIQMDLKIDGLTPAIIKSALDLTRAARFEILDECMLPCLPEARDDLSPYAPKMIQTQIEVDKIRDVIGKGGSVIQKIIADTGTKIDVEDDGRIFISAKNRDDCYKALRIIEAIVLDPQIGDVFYGKVTRLMTFGVFVEFAPGKEGMVHISKLAPQRVAKVEDVVAVGDMCWVKVVEIDEKGRINLSRKDAMAEKGLL